MLFSFSVQHCRFPSASVKNISVAVLKVLNVNHQGNLMVWLVSDVDNTTAFQAGEWGSIPILGDTPHYTSKSLWVTEFGFCL